MTTTPSKAQLGQVPDQRHPHDHYYKPGMPLRPAPARALPSDTWLPMRKRLFSAWIDVKPVPDMTPKLEVLTDHLWQGDELGDAVVALGKKVGPAQLRDMFEVAVERGVDAVPDAPQELRDLFADMTRLPEWFDAESYERGRLLLIDCSPIGKTGGTLVNVIMTGLGEAVGSATGATARFKRDPYRRNLETAEFFRLIPMPDALSPDSETFKTNARVRFMHCQVRSALRAKWGPEVYARHGDPISNTDMCLGVPAYAAVNLLIDQSFGRTVTERDLDDVTMFWAYHAFRFGIAEAVLPRSGREAVEQYDWTLATYGKADNPWADEVAEAVVSVFMETATVYESALGRFLGRHVLNPLTLGLIVNVGGDPLGYRTAGSIGVPRTTLRLYEAAAKVVGHGLVRLIALGDRKPGREDRIRAKGVNGDPDTNKNIEVLRRLCAKHGVADATFTHHDASTAASVAAR